MTQYADKRPRVAVIGLNDTQTVSIEHLCGTLRTAPSLSNYLSRYSWNETDIAVIGSYFFPAILEVRGHLLAIGTSAVMWTGYGLERLDGSRIVSGQTTNTERELSIPEDCPERYRHLAVDLAKQLRLQENPPWTYSAELTEDDNVLARTTSGRPVALRHVFKSELLPALELPATSAIALALPGGVDIAAWFAAFLGDVHEIDPARVPQPTPGIADATSWYTPEERKWAQRIAEIRGEVGQLLNEHQEAEAQLATANKQADAGKRRCLWADGEDLVKAVGEVLEELGFVVRNMDAEKGPGELRREDLRLTVPDRDGWEAVAEVKGYPAGTKTNDARQIREHRDLYISEEGHPPDLTLWITNTHKSVEDPSSRPTPSNDVGQRADLIEAVHVLVADLYRLWVLVQAGSLEQSQALQHLIGASPGLWSLPTSDTGTNT